MKNNLKIGDYVIINYNDGEPDLISEIIDISHKEIQCKVIIDDDDPKNPNDVFIMSISSLISNEYYKIATEEQISKINKRLVFQ